MRHATYLVVGMLGSKARGSALGSTGPLNPSHSHPDGRGRAIHQKRVSGNCASDRHTRCFNLACTCKCHSAALDEPSYGPMREDL